MDYESFVSNKVVRFEPKGFDVPLDAFNLDSFGLRHQFQPHVIKWAIERGSCAIFANYGFGKTRIQLHWADQIAKHENGRVLLLAPLAVADQTVREAQQIGIDLKYCRDESEAGGRPLTITNYDMLKHFDPSKYIGIVLDESSILKQYRGKTKEFLCNSFSQTPYRLCCSATPAPNDWLELGNHVEFLGITTSHLMISRWFQNDTMKAGRYKLKPHAAADFWDWVASWAVCLTLPSDLGFSDQGWLLPPHHTHFHTVSVDHSETWGESDKSGQLSFIRTASLSATDTHREMKRNVGRVAAKIADLVKENIDDAWALWCFTDYESDAICKALPSAIALKGSESRQSKSEKLRAFSNGEILHLVTKPEIAGLGLNWQHCHRQAFSMGTSHSFEQYHQALHRLYRFGQQYPVDTHLVFPETAGSVRQSIARKQRQHEAMQDALRQSVQKSQLNAHNRVRYDDYNPTKQMEVPSWLISKAS